MHVELCRAGLHDLGVPENVIVRRRDRLCRPCFVTYQREYRHQQRRAAGVPERPTPSSPRGPRPSPEQVQAERRRFLELLEQGWSIRRAALEVGHDPWWGQRVAREAGVRSRFAPGEQEGRS